MLDNNQKYTFYFYHLKGIKIGCTINPARRFIKNQKKYGRKAKHKILLVKNTDIYDATNIEADLAKEYGYINHSPYFRTFINSMMIKESDDIQKKISSNNWLLQNKCTDEYRVKMSKSLIRLNRKRGAIGREKLGTGIKENNTYYGKNYYLNKTEEELKEISRKRSESNAKNKENHMHKGGNKVVLFGIIYKSINEASKILGYSFKYLKRRVVEIEYKDCYFV
jgi:hypothetical protein